MYLCNYRPPRIAVDKTGQRFVAGNQRLLVRIHEQRVLHKTVKVGGDHQIVGFLILRQQLGQNMVAHAGLLAFHQLLQSMVPISRIEAELQFVQVEIIFAGQSFAFLLGDFPLFLYFAKRMLDYFVVQQSLRRVQKILIVLTILHDFFHPAHFQFLAVNNAGLYRCTGTQNEAKSLRVGSIFIYLCKLFRCYNSRLGKIHGSYPLYRDIIPADSTDVNKKTVSFAI